MTSKDKISKDKIIDTQIAALVNDAPDPMMAGAIQNLSPVLKVIATRQKHLTYFVLQSTNNLLLITLVYRSQPAISKNVVYAYPSRAIADAERLQMIDQPNCQEIAIIPLLFQLLGMNEVDSLILLGDRSETKGTEINRQKLYDSCQQELQKSETKRRSTTFIA